MMTTLTLAVAVCLVAQTGLQETQEPEAEINWSSEPGPDTYYTSRLTLARLEATPKWKAEEENPPVSARKAIAVAEAILKELQPYGPDAKFEAPTLKLRECRGDWFWVVYYSPNDWRRFQSSFPIVVLMDGSVVRPERSTPPQQLLIDGK
jgi:hypothetical protein